MKNPFRWPLSLCRSPVLPSLLLGASLLGAVPALSAHAGDTAQGGAETPATAGAAAASATGAAPAGGQPAATDWKTGPQRVGSLEVELVSDATQVVPGETFRVGLRLRHDPHWHTYWRNPGDTGFPTSFVLEGPEGTRYSDIRWPAPSRLAIGPLANYGYEGEALIYRDVTLPAGFASRQAHFQVHTEWLICKEVCIPGDAALQLDIPVGGATMHDQAELAGFEDARRHAPAADQKPAQAGWWQRGGHSVLVLPAALTEEKAPKSALFLPYFAGVVRPAAPQKLIEISGESGRYGIALELDEQAMRTAEAGWEAQGGMVVIDGQQPVELALKSQTVVPVAARTVSVNEPVQVDVSGAEGGGQGAQAAQGKGSFMGQLQMGAAPAGAQGGAAGAEAAGARTGAQAGQAGAAPAAAGAATGAAGQDAGSGAGPDAAAGAGAASGATSGAAGTTATTGGAAASAQGAPAGGSAAAGGAASRAPGATGGTPAAGAPGAMGAQPGADPTAAQNGQSMTEASGALAQLTGASEGEGSWLTLAGAILGAFLGGLILNLMPCVFPVIGLKVLSFTEAAAGKPAEARRHAMVFGLGVVVSFVALAGVLLGLRALGQAAGWGFQLQSPVFVAVLALLFVVIGLNLFGVFETGTRLTQLGAMGGGQGSRQGYGSSFMTGVMAVVVATPCTAPFMGSAVGFTLSSSALLVLAVFVAIGVGMALPYLLLASSQRLLAMLPRPGVWLQTFKQFLAFPMFITAAWLTWVLALQAEAEGVLLLLLAAIFLAFSCWIYGRWQFELRPRGARSTPAWIFVALLSLGAVVGLLSRLPVVADASVAQAGGTEAVAAVEPGSAVAAGAGVAGMPAGGAGGACRPGADGKLPAACRGWQPWSAERFAAARQAGVPVFVDFTAAWCLSCQVNQKVALDRDEVQAAFRERNVLLLKADWTKRDPAISAELARYGRNSVPLYLYFEGRDPNAAPRRLPELLTVDTVLTAIGAQKG